MKNKKLAISLAAMLSMNLFAPFVYADNVIVDSIASVNGADNGVDVGVDTTQGQKTTYNDETTDPINGEGTRDTYVYVSQASTFSVKIPKLIILDGKKDDNGLNKGAYVVNVSGNFGGEEFVNVVPDDSVTLKQLGKTDISATITQDKESWAYNELDTVGNGVISTSEMSAGSWNGAFVFNIELAGKNAEQECNHDFGQLGGFLDEECLLCGTPHYTYTPTTLSAENVEVNVNNYGWAYDGVGIYTIPMTYFEYDGKIYKLDQETAKYEAFSKPFNGETIIVSKIEPSGDNVVLTYEDEFMGTQTITTSLQLATPIEY